MTAPQTKFGQSDAAALELVALLTAANTANAFCLAIAPVRLFARKLDLKDIPIADQPVAVQVVPGHDQGDRDGMGGMYNDTYGVHVLLLQVCGANVETQCPLLMQLRSEIVEYLCGKGLTCPEGTVVHPFARAQVIGHRHGPEGVYDLTRLEDHAGLFYSDIILTYKAGGLRRQDT
jgi:hypothetical protein